jgi:hypothetical protein
MVLPFSREGKEATSSKLGTAYTSSVLWCLQSSKYTAGLLEDDASCINTHFVRAEL